MKHLGRGISSEKTNAAGILIHSLSQLPGMLLRSLEGEIPVMMILTEKTVERAAMIEYGQIEIPPLRSPLPGIGGVSTPRATRADPICHAVGGKGILIP